MLDFLFSPAGLAAYAAFWALKLTLGVWLARRAVGLVPVRLRVRVRSAGRRHGLFRRRRVAVRAAVLDPASLPFAAGK